MSGFEYPSSKCSAYLRGRNECEDTGREFAEIGGLQSEHPSTSQLLMLPIMHISQPFKWTRSNGHRLVNFELQAK